MNINKSICPICGKPNNCAFEAGLSHKKCWCEEISVSEELMEKVPSDLKRKNSQIISLLWNIWIEL